MEITPDELASFIERWVFENTDYQKRIKPALTAADSRKLAEAILELYSVIARDPGSYSFLPELEAK